MQENKEFVMPLLPNKKFEPQIEMLDLSKNIISSKEPLTLFYGGIHARDQFEVYQ